MADDAADRNRTNEDPSSDAAPTTRSGEPTASTEPYPKRWLALAVIAVTVLMVILDATIVDIALPVVGAVVAGLLIKASKEDLPADGAVVHAG